MINSTHPAVSWYLLISAASFAVLFTLPLLLVPLKWARVLRWQVHDDDALAVYLGRSLGAAGCGIVYVTVRAARDPVAHPMIFELMIVAGALLTLVHIVGALQRKQPWTETAEIGFWAAVTVVAALVYRSLY
ncbi:MAG TPA: hypothetical protein VIV40_29545 [Kofleriaceae bacterium]